MMKTLAKLEELAVVLLSIYLFSRLSYAWWVFPLFFFAPDVSLLGLLVGKRAGALSYDLVHHKAVAVGLYILGGLLRYPLLSLVGVLLLGHSSFDRILGLSLMDPTGQAPVAFGPFGQRA